MVWEDAVEKQVDGQQSLVVVPILSLETQLKFSMKTDTDGKKKKAEDTYISADVKTSLVFSKTGEKIDVLEMRLIRDEDYYLKKKEKKIESRDFEGLLYFFNEEEKLVSGAQFKNGKVVGTLGATNKRGRTSDVLLEVCTDWYKVVTVNGQVVAYENEPYDTTCEFVGIDGGGSGSSSSSFFVTALEGSAGGGGSNYGSLNQLLQLPHISIYWSQINDNEKTYFTNNYWLLPGAALAFLEANLAVNLFYCTNGDNGNWNAFKHAFWTAMLCVHVGPFRALTITDNHESYPSDYDQYSEAAKAEFEKKRNMDLDNNHLGMITYYAVKNSLSSAPNPSSSGIVYASNLTLVTEEVFDRINAGYGVRLVTENNILTDKPTTNGDRCR